VIDSPSPWYGIESMVTRADPTGRYPGRLWADQSISIAEALLAHTAIAAEALGLEDEIGRITRGLSADFVVMDQDPLNTAPEQLHAFTARETVLAGRTVHRIDDDLSTPTHSPTLT